MRFRDGSVKETALNFVQISEKVRQRPWQCLDKRTGNKPWAVLGKSKLTETKKKKKKKGATGEEQNQEYDHHFSLKSRGLSTKWSSRQAIQSFPLTTVTFYGYCLKMYEDFVPNFDEKRTGCCITTAHRFTLPFSLGNFLSKTTWLLSPTHPTFPCVPDWRWN
jgi:hypothetical protein